MASTSRFPAPKYLRIHSFDCALLLHVVNCYELRCFLCSDFFRSFCRWNIASYQAFRSRIINVCWHCQKWMLKQGIWNLMTTRINQIQSLNNLMQKLNRGQITTIAMMVMKLTADVICVLCAVMLAADHVWQSIIHFLIVQPGLISFSY